MSDFLLKGFVGAVPEVATVKGIRIAKFIVALNCGCVDKPKKIWVRCVAWRELADLVEKRVFQGDSVGINGRISDVEAWIDPKSKKAKGTLEIRLDEVCKSVAPGVFENIRVRHESPKLRRLEGEPQPYDDLPF